MKISDINIENLNEVLNLQEDVYNQLEDKEVLEKIDRKEMSQILTSNYSVGVYENGKLLAMRGLYIPNTNEPEHLADDVGVNRNETIYSEITIIHESLRGQNLQYKMGIVLLDRLKKDKQYRYLIGTVMPTNIPSLKNTMKLGLDIVNTKIKYGNKRRHILMLDLQKKTSRKGAPIKIKYDDFEWMMAHSKDYVGVEFDGEYIKYYKK